MLGDQVPERNFLPQHSPRWTAMSSSLNTRTGRSRPPRYPDGLRRVVDEMLIQPWRCRADSETTVQRVPAMCPRSQNRAAETASAHQSAGRVIYTGMENEAHPAFCALFVLVGEGGAAQWV